MMQTVAATTTIIKTFIGSPRIFCDDDPDDFVPSKCSVVSIF